jgi:hypothetical protein
VTVFLGRGNGQFAPAPFGDKPQRHREHRDSYVLLCVLCASVAEFSVPRRPMRFHRGLLGR